MDLLRYLQACRVWVCVPCGFAVNSHHYETHLKTRRADHSEMQHRVRLLQDEMKEKVERLYSSREWSFLLHGVASVFFLHWYGAQLPVCHMERPSQWSDFGSRECVKPDGPIRPV